MKYRKKPVEIEAWQSTGDPKTKGVCWLRSCGGARPHLHTIHKGQAVVISEGGWIIPEPDGTHFYPCKPDIFEAIYEPVT